MYRFLRKLTNSKNPQEINIKLFEKVAIFENGHCFGELALINFKRRAARVICIQDTSFGILEKHDYQKIIGNKMKFEL